MTTVFPNDNELLLLLRTNILDVYILNDKDNGVTSFIKHNKDLNGKSVSLFDVCKKYGINVWYQIGKSSEFKKVSNSTDLLSKTHIILYSDDYNGMLSNYLFKLYLKNNNSETYYISYNFNCYSVTNIQEDIEELIRNNQYPVLNIFGNDENIYAFTNLLEKYPELMINIYHKGFEVKRLKASEVLSRLFVFNKNTACSKVYDMLGYNPNTAPLVNFIARYTTLYNYGDWNTESFRFEEYKEVFGFIEYLNFYVKDDILAFQTLLEKIRYDYEYYSTIVKPIGATIFLQKMEDVYSKVLSPDRLYIQKVYSENHSLHLCVFQGSSSIYNELNLRMCHQKETDDVVYVVVEPIVSEGLCNVYIKSITNRNISTIINSASEMLSKIMNKYASNGMPVTKCFETSNYCKICLPLSYGSKFFENSMYDFI